MAKYVVNLSRVEWGEITVEADSKENAEKEAVYSVECGGFVGGEVEWEFHDVVCVSNDDPDPSK